MVWEPQAYNVFCVLCTKEMQCLEKVLNPQRIDLEVLKEQQAEENRAYQ